MTKKKAEQEEAPISPFDELGPTVNPYYVAGTAEHASMDFDTRHALENRNAQVPEPARADAPVPTRYAPDGSIMTEEDYQAMREGDEKAYQKAVEEAIKADEEASKKSKPADKEEAHS